MTSLRASWRISRKKLILSEGMLPTRESR